MKTLRTLICLFGAVTLAAFFGAVRAQSSTDSGQPVRILVVYPPGGPADTIARTLAPHLSEAWHKNVIVENRPGAGGAIAASAVLREPADGGTLLFTSTTHLQAIGLKMPLSYDPVKDFSPITKIGNGPLVFAVRADGPQDLDGFIQAAKQRPMSYASFGPATTGHIYGEKLNKEAGINVSNVPYLGGSPAVMALLGGHADASFIEVTQALPLIQTNKVRALAIIGHERHGQLPDVPTFAELGMKGFELVGFHAVLARAGAKPEVLQRISDGFQQAMQRPQVRERLEELGLQLVGNTAQDWSKTFSSEATQWTELITEVGVSVDK